MRLAFWKCEYIRNIIFIRVINDHHDLYNI